MKVLFISGLHPHYLKNSLYIGLSRILENDIHIFPEPYIDIKNLKVRYNNKSFLNLNKIKCNLDNYDYIIIGELCNYTKNIINYILKNNTKKNIVVVDLDDIPHIRKIIFHKNVIVYFKREKLINNPSSYMYLKKHFPAVIYHNLKTLAKGYYDYVWLYDLYVFPSIMGITDKIFPIPLGVSNLIEYYPELKNIKEKKYDVSFIATPNTKERKLIFKLLKDIEKKYDINCYLNKGSLDFKEYLNIISSSKISINTYGYGVDTFRYYEIPYLNSMLLTKRPIIEIPNNFINGESVVFYNDIKEIENLIVEYLEKNRWKKISKSGHNHVIKHFIDVKLAKYFLETVESIL